ncbi:MAG TPA: M1 family metallopeptidase [Pyrinomonadaceae bacterium]|nr:M1 family metallopeptidase [Chloracidobacterium sp.]MBP9935782.1 M1 family metallopeptidase [Pyrinomonadaceae bacterium]MBK9436586.1 M1 family metallopeptidase [Chloracidobacterium sp.]MBL0241574.1 M1 family metallopeptidase [Chloracidobacterium sp.]HQX56243.1 M1 family metallopeptidase [Pyrinomonadaceae bacterium]
MKNLSWSIFVLLFSFTAILAQRELGVRPTDSGGPLMFEQAVFDVQNYDISISADPKTKSIAGTTVMTARTVIPTNVIVLDLDSAYTISKLTDGIHDLKYERKAGKIWIWFPMTKQVGEEIKTSITYAGVPKEAPRPPWVGGFMWKKTPNGADWISVALQNDGADLMFPCKDHPSDKAATVSMHITVPDPLMAVGPGKYQGVKKNADSTSTYNWRMTNPIANYSIVFNAAPYKIIEDKYTTATGETMPIYFYILPESFEKGARLIAEQKKYLAFYEKYLGPYPFRSQKVGIVETPHLGMEHSTAIAYGNQFKYNDDGTDTLLLHEFGHEYWANLVTASDWRDFWIHEGFQSYMDTLYTETLHGKDAYMRSMRNRQRGFKNKQAVAPREPKLTYQVYMSEPDYVNSDGDIYGKGSYILHTLRYLVGDAAFFRSLRRMAYPTKAMEKLTDGSQERLVNTDDFLTIVNEESKMNLDWYFELYLRQPKLPTLVFSTTPECTSNCTMSLSWQTPNNMPFPMPVDVVIGGKSQRIEMKGGKGSVTYNGAAPAVDPDGWVLKSLSR